MWDILEEEVEIVRDSKLPGMMIYKRLYLNFQI